jgi:uncharacterized membrane protein YjfL (UPF0719 family)
MDWTILLAQDAAAATVTSDSWTEVLVRNVVAAAAFGLVGVAMFAVAYAVIRKLVPFSIEKEIAEDQNTALGIVMGSLVLGIALIVAAAIH